MTKQLKGDTFQNRYRISGTLTTQSPLHIGSGAEDPNRLLGSARRNEGGDVPMAAAVVKDAGGRPYLPGSTLRGVLRHWLRDVLVPCGPDWAAEHDYEALGRQDQRAQGEAARTTFSWLEVLFGTPLAAGKLEVWDAPCRAGPVQGSEKLLHWDPNSLTYVETSAAIDPATGTVLDRHLYNMEVVPKGLQFEVNIVGQNLDNTELGLVLLALEGFNSFIYPVTLGAKPGSGRGRLQWKPGRIACLERPNMTAWVQSTLNDALAGWTGGVPTAGAPAPGVVSRPAGYYALPELTEAQVRAKIAQVKQTIRFAPPPAAVERPREAP